MSFPKFRFCRNAKERTDLDFVGGSDGEDMIKNEEESGTPAPPSVVGGDEVIESGDIAGFEPVSFHFSSY